MISNCNGMIRVNENDVLNCDKPKGFIVREKLDEGNPVSLEYGTYLDNDVFLGVPIHFNLKDKLVPTSMNTSDFNYYFLPQNIQLAVSTYKSKTSGKINPMLVEPTDNRPALLISSLAYRDNTNTITDLAIDDNHTVILRKYIDKDRKVIGIIAVNTDANVINPISNIRLEYGILGTKVKTVCKYTFDVTIDGGCHKEIDSEPISGKLATSFIKLKNYIRPEKKKFVKHETATATTEAE